MVARLSGATASRVANAPSSGSPAAKLLAHAIAALLNNATNLTMSSLLDAALRSDAAPTPGSEPGDSRRHQFRSSSVRPRAPPSESAGAHSDHEGFADDEVVGARGAGRRPNGPRTDIPKVVDVTGETLSQRFQEFLER